MSGSKAKSERRHAKQRAWERYSVELSDRDLNDLCSQIRSSRARFVQRESLRLTHWDVRCGDATMRAVYDKERGQIVTFLPSPAPVPSPESETP